MKRTIFCLVMIILACPLGTAQAASTSLNCTYRNNDGPPFQLGNTVTRPLTPFWCPPLRLWLRTASGGSERSSE